jgi:hypothetical protein
MFLEAAKDEGLHASTCNFCSCVFVRHAIVSNHPACPSAVLPDAADRVTDRTDHPGGGASPACMVVMFVSDPQPFRAGDIRTQTRNLSLTPTTRHTQRPADPKFPTFGGFWLVPRTLPWSSTCRSLAGCSLDRWRNCLPPIDVRFNLRGRHLVTRTPQRNVGQRTTPANADCGS